MDQAICPLATSCYEAAEGPSNGTGSGRRDESKEGEGEEEAESGPRRMEQRGRATKLNLITGPHGQFSRHKGSERGPCVVAGQSVLQFLRKQ